MTWRLPGIFLVLGAVAFGAQLEHHTPAQPIEGILELPTILGEHACARYTPDAMVVREAPSMGSGVIGTLEVSREWYDEGSDSCTMIAVEFRPADAAPPRPVSMREYAYEQPGLAVIEHNRNAFRVAFDGGSGWIHPTVFRFFSYRQLIRDSLAYVPEGWSGELWEEPGMDGPSRVPAAWERIVDGDDVTVDVVEDRVVDGNLWLKLRFGPDTGCGDISGDLPSVEGWIPGHMPDGRNAVWFHSRGC